MINVTFAYLQAVRRRRSGVNGRQERRCITAALLLSFSLMLIACEGIVATPINKILENPRNYSDRPVTISGEVAEVFSLVVVKYFVVRDKTGEIIVVTKKTLPPEGTKITVKGTVREAFSIGDKQLLVVMENEER